MTTSVVFSHEEYARRLAAMRAKMRERAAELVLVDEAEHLAYLTGFDRPDGASLWRPDVLIVRQLSESGLARPMTLVEGAPEPRTAADDRDAVAATQAQGIAPAAAL